jgi:hypothetical protein
MGQGDEHPTGIYDAESCDAIGDLRFELEPFVDESSQTTLADTMLEMVADGAGAIVVMLSGEDDTVVACGMLPEFQQP